MHDPSSVPSAPICDTGMLAELEDIFGRSRLMDLLRQLKAEIAQRLRSSAEDRTALGLDAHALLSVSGSLGFTDLSQRCSEMEEAYIMGADLDAPLNAARIAARGAIDAICALEAAA